MCHPSPAVALMWPVGLYTLLNTRLVTPYEIGWRLRVKEAFIYKHTSVAGFFAEALFT